MDINNIMNIGSMAIVRARIKRLLKCIFGELKYSHEKSNIRFSSAPSPRLIRTCRCVPVCIDGIRACCSRPFVSSASDERYASFIVCARVRAWVFVHVCVCVYMRGNRGTVACTCLWWLPPGTSA